MPVIQDDVEVLFSGPEGQRYLADGLVVIGEGKEAKIVGRWDPPLGEDAEDRQAKEFAEDDEEDVALPDPEDDTLWERLERESNQRIEKAGRRTAAELLSFVRPYNYGKKLDDIHGVLQDRLGQLAADLRDGRIKQSQWALDSKRALVGHNIDGYRLGVAQAKGVAPTKVKLTTEQRKLANDLVADQNKYFAKFNDKVKAQLADGKDLTTALDARAKLYAGSVRSAASKARLDEDGEKKLRWVRYPGDSCETCLKHGGEVRTGKQWRELDVWPAHNVTCHGNCRCVWGEVK